jgi:hypothetical protein
MPLLSFLKTGSCAIALCLCAQTQTPPQTPPAKEAPVESRGMPPRAAASEFPHHAQLGPVTIAAEFTGHGIGTPQGALTSEDYVAVEVGFYGAEGTRARLSIDDFSLRVNGKKVGLRGQPYGMVLSSLKDPEWEPPSTETKKSKTSMGGGGEGGGQNNDPPPVPKMTFAERRAMEQKVQKSTLPEGDRALPVAGLIFFQYRGKTQGIKTLELLYDGPAGKATLNLQP